MQLALQMVRMEYTEGTRLFKQGDHGDYFYVLLKGNAEALVREVRALLHHLFSLCL